MNETMAKEHLYECLRQEVMKSTKKFSWARAIHKAIKCPERRYHFWWRIASYMYNRKNKCSRFISKRINRKLILKYGCEIQLGAYIGPGLVISHHNGIVINGSARIGSCFRVRQNTTIGIHGGNKKTEFTEIIIGDNVEVGAGSCIISNKIKIGDNVIIGAMSFINRDIPSNSTAYNKKEIIITPNINEG